MSFEHVLPPRREAEPPARQFVKRALHARAKERDGVAQDRDRHRAGTEATADEEEGAEAWSP
ncbi:MAG: hypothetical protein QM820_45255 [Minicystis sp.]